MKILAIRGKNLASLGGSFELPLAEGALARAGVFAICGATGAGKSTLLDAMCLALYDTAPRLDGRRRARVGRVEDGDARLTATDPRSILRKGAAAGFAEVDFEGADERLYRARWEARRARDRPDGKLQPVTMSLEELGTDRRWAGRKTDVKDAIERSLGLSFEQFRRSVLLAQGEFAAFLDADPRERAQLLERMTGTAIYGAISIEAHERAGRERRTLETLEERRGAIHVFSVEERELLDRRADELGLAVRRDEKATRDAEAAVRWHHQREVLRAEEAEARATSEAIERQLALWETRRRELDAIEGALPVRGPLDALTSAESTSRELRAEVEVAARAAEESRVASSEAAETAQAASDDLARAEATRRELGAVIERARGLDRELVGASGRSKTTRARQGAARSELADLVARLAELREAADAQRRGAEAHVAWLDEHASAGALAGDWARTEDRLDRLVAVLERIAKSRASLSGLSAAHERAGRAHSVAEGRRLGLGRVRLEREATWSEARRVALEAPSDALANVRDKWVARRTALETLVGVADAAREAFEAEERHRDRARRASERTQAADDTARVVERERDVALGRLEEAEAQRDRTRATLDLAAHRAELVEGEACPLCGGHEHPYAATTPDVDVSGVDQRVRELRAEHTRHEARLAELRQDTVAQRATEREAGLEGDAWAEKLGRARERYRVTAHELGTGEGEAWPEELPSAAPADSATKDWGPLFALVEPRPEGGSPVLEEGARSGLSRARAEAIEQLEQVERAVRARRDTERHAEGVRARWEASVADADRARRERDETAREQERSARELDGCVRELQRAEGERAGWEEALDPLLGAWSTGWRKQLGSDPLGLRRELAAAVDAHRTRIAELAASRAEEARLAPLLERTEAEREAAARQVETAAAELEGLVAEEARVRAERVATLEGDADVVAATSSTALERATAAARTALAARDEITRRDALAIAHRDRAVLAEGEAKVALEAVEASLAEALAAADLELATARTLLAHDPREVQAWRGELADLDRARSEAEVVLSERARKRAEHEETDPPVSRRVDPERAENALSAPDVEVTPLDAEAARVEAHGARERLEATRELLHSVRGRLERDDLERARAADLAVELSRVRGSLDVWLTLADLIGSASGNKLRVFAQSLTLELLLEHANVQLRDLAPRYGLSRIPGESLDLQVVDHEMGDEVRAVGSLSGGESFLVALGLALGLASLSSERARVDTLFIDEGFGALDPSSLEMVLSTLDALQATGRQVGLISHVPTVAERFATRVEVVAAGPARSRVRLVDPGPAGR